MNRKNYDLVNIEGWTVGLGLSLVLILTACSGPQVKSDSVQPPVEIAQAAATITPSDIHARIAFLASDALKGRDTPSQGLESAAAYIASEYARLGLEPHGDDGGFLQRYPYTIRTLRRDSTYVQITAGGTETLPLGNEMFAMAGTPSTAAGDLLFTGTTVAAGTQLNGAIPVVYIGGALDRAWRTALTSARNAARTAGANALMVVLDPSISGDVVMQRSLTSAATGAVAPFPPIVAIRYDRAAQLFKKNGVDFDALVTRAKAGPIAAVPLKASARVATPVTEVVHHPPNVVAILPGSDPVLRNQYVVLSAHMDHIGVSAPDARGDSINNGADDDASGTSAVVEAAEAFASMKDRPARSIIFLNVSGEEKGLLGSQYFSEHPVVPLTSIVADINIDMIGRNAADTVVAIGQDYSSLGPLTQEIVTAHPELHLTASRDIWPQERFFFRSDHYNFARKDIPAIFFFSGVHEDYHRPSDEVQKINTDKAARIARLAYYLAYEVANRREPPKWTEQGLKEVRALTR